jgi:hypothetical protein
MAFNIDPNIPLQAGKVNFDPAAIIMQAQQGAAALERHRLEMQKLRDDYDAAKEARKQQKAMQMGIASDLAGIQAGTPAQYSPMTYQQTPRQGQMPFGMTGVLASERGQNMPQPQIFGEDVFSGNYQVGGGEVTQAAVAGHTPSYTEQLQIAAKNALAVGDTDSAFKYAQALQQQRQADRELSAPVGNPYPRYDDKGNFVGTYVMTKIGEMPLGQQGTTTVKPDVITAKDKFERDFQERKLRAEQDKTAKELALKEREITLKPNPISQAIEIERGKEAIKQENAVKAAQREKLTNANEGLPLLDNYINALKESPQTGAGESYEKAMGYIGMGNTSQQAAMAKAKQAGESLLTFAQKQPGPSTDKDVASYRAQMGVVVDASLPTSARVAAAEQAKSLLVKIQSKYGNYQDGGQSQQPTQSKQADYMEYKQERAKAYKTGNMDLVRKMDAMAKQDGLIK